MRNDNDAATVGEVRRLNERVTRLEEPQVVLAEENDRLRRALRDLVGGVRTLKLAHHLPGPVARAEAALGNVS